MRRAFTLIEMLTCIAILGLLIAILLPVLSNSKKSSYKATCQGNLRTVGQAVRLYVDDYDGTWPDYQVWTSWNRMDNAIPKSARGSAPKLAGCPQANVPVDRQLEMQVAGHIVGYAYNITIDAWNRFTKNATGELIFRETSFTTDNDILYPATTVAFLDASIDKSATDKADPFENADPYPYNVEKGFDRHNGGANYLFCDGHVEWLHKDQVLPSYPAINDGTKPSFALSTRESL